MSELRFPVRLVCPLCHQPPLNRDGDRILCPPCDRSDCPREFSMKDGVADLIVGYRFDDDKDEGCLCYEESSNDYTARHYWLPHFERLLGSNGRPRRLLALGCGIGTEVDVLREAGFECVGVDCGSRADRWNQRTSKGCFALANGMHLPFEDNVFDGVFCGCLFPHVGVAGDSGDSYTVSPHHDRDRLAVAKEITRVLKPGGHAVVASPNRRFPLDIFHGRDDGRFRPRLNLPTDRFLLSVGDYRHLFERAGCGRVKALPVSGYWGFVRSANSLKGRLLGFPVRSAFALVSLPWLGWLRSWPISPWIAVSAVK